MIADNGNESIADAFPWGQVTPADIDGFALEELKVILASAVECIKEKDANLVFAAEIGKSLLEANQKLQTDYDALVASTAAAKAHSDVAATDQQPSPQTLAKRPSRQRDDTSPHSEEPTSESAPAQPVPAVAVSKTDQSTTAYIHELEKTKVEQTNKIEALTNQLDSNEKSYEKTLREIQSEIKRLQDEKDLFTATIRDLEESNADLAHEKAELFVRLRTSSDTNHKLDSTKSQLVELEAKCLEYENMFMMLADNKQMLEEKLTALMEESEVMATRKAELEEELIETRNAKEELETMRRDYEDTCLALEDERAVAVDLRNKLMALIPNTDAPPSPGSKSLFSEVEDRRVELEEKHAHLSQKHVGLVKAHTVSLHQQERLKNHISRLTQLNQQRGTVGEDRASQLERALGQIEAENKELRRKVMILEKNGGAGSKNGLHFAEDFADEDSEGISQSNANPELVELLQIQLDSVEQERTQLKKELRTLQMLKLAETEKVRSLESELHEMKREVDKHVVTIAELKFMCGELKDKLQRIRNGEDGDGLAGDDKKTQSIGTQTLLSSSVAKSSGPPGSPAVAKLRAPDMSTLMRQLSPARKVQIPSSALSTPKVKPSPLAGHQGQQQQQQSQFISTPLRSPIRKQEPAISLMLAHEAEDEDTENIPIDALKKEEPVALKSPVSTQPKVLAEKNVTEQPPIQPQQDKTSAAIMKKLQETDYKPTANKNINVVVKKKGDVQPGECKQQ